VHRCPVGFDWLLLLFGMLLLIYRVMTSSPTGWLWLAARYGA